MIDEGFLKPSPLRLYTLYEPGSRSDAYILDCGTHAGSRLADVPSQHLVYLWISEPDVWKYFQMGTKFLNGLPSLPRFPARNKAGKNGQKKERNKAILSLPCLRVDEVLPISRCSKQSTLPMAAVKRGTRGCHRGLNESGNWLIDDHYH